MPPLALRPATARSGRGVALRLGCAVALALTLAGCSSPRPNRDAARELFPTVRGTALDGTEWTLPADLDGRPAVLLVGYVMETQFDLDRWLLGLAQAGTPVAVLELPTIEGMVPGLISGRIDSGMREGIPQEDWGLVVTLYGESASTLVEATGNTRPRNGRVFLLDSDGRIAWFHDRGYSTAHLLELDATARTLVDD